MAKKTAVKTKKLGRPAKPPGERCLPVSASVPAPLVAKLATYEARHGITRSAAVAEAIRRLVG